MFPIALPCAFLRGPLLLLVLLFVPQAVAQLGPDSLRFAVIADPQYADKPVRGSRRWTQPSRSSTGWRRTRRRSCFCSGIISIRTVKIPKIRPSRWLISTQ